MSAERHRRTRGRRASFRQHRRKKPGWNWRRFARLGILACVVLVLGLVAWAALARVLAPASNTAQDRFDVLIVLGSPADADGNPSPMMQARVTEAVHEYERGVAPRMILTGGAAHNQFVEADVMARVAEAQGIPASVIVEEPLALDTIQNTCNSLKIMRRHGWESAEVISNSSHLPRAGLILSRLPLQWRVHAAPTLEPEGSWMSTATETVEILKTVRYLIWTRQTERCAL